MIRCFSRRWRSLLAPAGDLRMRTAAVAAIVLCLCACAGSGLSQAQASHVLSASPATVLTHEITLPSMKLPEEDLLTMALAEHGFISVQNYDMELTTRGRLYGERHGWAQKPDAYAPGSTDWIIPYARMEVLAINGISIDDAIHAHVQYGYVVEPNEIGRMMQDDADRVSDYALTGYGDVAHWSDPKDAVATLVRYDSGWQVDQLRTNRD